MQSIIELSPLILLFSIILSFIFRKGNKRVLWVLIFLYISISGLSLRIVSGIITYSLPTSAVIVGVNPPYVSGIVSVCILLLTFPLIFLCRKEKSHINNLSKKYRGGFFGTGLLLIITAFGLFFISIYFPTFIGINNAAPKIGVWSLIILLIMGSFVLYYSSKMNSPQKPNLMRWLVFLAVVPFSLAAIYSMLLLIYAVPAQEKVTYPFLANIVSFVNLILCIVTIGIAKDYVIRQ